MDYQRVIKKIEEWTTQLWKVGMVEHPLFTLHGQDHSEKILSNLDKIVKTVKPTKRLNDCEWFCLRAAVLLHDLGMLYDYNQLMLDLGCDIPGTRKHHLDALHTFIGQYADQRYVDELRTEIRQKMEIRPQAKTDLMRRLHGTISFYLILKYKKELEITENQIFQPIAAIARSHTGVRFPLPDSDSTMIGTFSVRTSFLAAMLSLADEVDFFGSRVPDEIFHFYANRVVLDSRALAHWIKHYYITGVEFGRMSYETASSLHVKIEADVPNEQVSKLLSSFLKESDRKLVKCELANTFAKYSDISSVSVLPQINVTSAAKTLPQEIVDRMTIQHSTDQEFTVVVRASTPSSEKNIRLLIFLTTYQASGLLSQEIGVT